MKGTEAFSDYETVLNVLRFSSMAVRFIHESL